jgi:subtilisin
MRRQFVLALAVLCALFGAANATAAHEESYIVVLRNGVDLQSTLKDQVRRRGLDVSQVYGHALNGYAAGMSPSDAAALKKDARVQYVVKDRAVKLAAQNIPTGVARIGASNAQVGSNLLGTSRGRGVGVAVIDTGIDLNHPDLGTVVPGTNCIKKTQLPNDDNGHGTHVAGTIAARDNDRGVVGVAPDATLYAVKSIDAYGNGTWSTVICGIDWATANAGAIRVVNMSLTSRANATPSDALCRNQNSDPVHTAICASTLAGITYVAAAGNSSDDAGKYIPAAYDEVITVSALADSDGAPGGLGLPPSCFAGQQDDHLASFSNYGGAVDLAAPGVCIESTYMGGGYATLSGTSMAAPHVAGAAARYIGTNPLARPADVRAALIAAAEPGPIPGDPDSSAEGVVRVSVPPPVIGLPGLPGLPPLPPGPPGTDPPQLPPIPDLP